MTFEYYCLYKRTIKITEISYSYCTHSLNIEEFRALARKFHQHLDSLKNKNKNLPCLNEDYCIIRFREGRYYIRYDVLIHNMAGKLNVTSIEKAQAQGLSCLSIDSSIDK